MPLRQNTLRPPAVHSPGGQPGNTNALKHGFYSPRFNKKDLKDLSACEFTGLNDEIAMLRVYIRRALQFDETVQTLPEALALLRALSLASLSITRLIKTQHFIAPIPDPIHEALDQALTEVLAEIEAENASRRGEAAGPRTGDFGRGEAKTD